MASSHRSVTGIHDSCEPFAVDLLDHVALSPDLSGMDLMALESTDGLPLGTSLESFMAGIETIRTEESFHNQGWLQEFLEGMQGPDWANDFLVLRLIPSLSSL